MCEYQQQCQVQVFSVVKLEFYQKTFSSPGCEDKIQFSAKKLSQRQHSGPAGPGNTGAGPAAWLGEGGGNWWGDRGGCGWPYIYRPHLPKLQEYVAGCPGTERTHAKLQACLSTGLVHCVLVLVEAGTIIELVARDSEERGLLEDAVMVKNLANEHA